MKNPAAIAVMLVLISACGRADETAESTIRAAPSTTAASTASQSSTTENSPSEESVQIAVIGDFGHGGDAEYEVAKAVSAHIDLDYLLTTGDNFYSDDVDTIWTEPYGWLADGPVTLFAAWGNHDVETKTRERLVREHLDLKRNWYTADLGPLLLVVLDSNQPDHQGQRQWLETRLKKADKPVVVTFHHALFSCGTHGSDTSVQRAWLDLFRHYEVTAVFNGHDHNYERFLDQSTHYIVTGGGGRPLRPFEECPEGTPEPLVGNDTLHHYVLVDVSSSRLTVRALAADGELIDSFRIELTGS